MNNVASSIRTGSFSHRGAAPLVVKTNDGQIRVETQIKSQFDQTPSYENTRFQSGSRASLLAAVSLASLMGANVASGQEAGVQLPTIDVTADQGGGYQATQQSITRLPTALINTPQTVNVVPQQVIKEQRANTMEDALRNVTGITFSAGEGGQQGDSPYIRGFTARGDIFRDGIRDPGWYTRDLFNIDRVEVYMGPSGFAFGRGSTGGAINNTSKLPTSGQFGEGTVTGTSVGGYRAEVDANGQRGNVTARIAALYEDVATPTRDNVYTKRWGVAPSVSVPLDDATKATLSYIYQGEESIPDYGFPYLPPPTYSTTTGALTNAGYNGNGTAVTPTRLPRNTFLGFTSGPFADVVDTNTHIVTSKIEREINSGTTLTNTTRYMRVDRFAMPTAPRNLGVAGRLTGAATTPLPGYPVDSMTIGLQHWENQTNNTQLINLTDVVSKFDTGSLNHTAAAGVEVSRETRHQQRDNLCFPATAATNPPGAPICRTTLVNPSPNPSTPVDLGWGPPQGTLMTNVGAYVSDQIKLNKYFEVMGSLRFDRLNTTYNDLTQTVVANQHLTSTDSMLGWRYGVVFHPMPNSSLFYASGVSCNPSSELGTLSSGTVSAAPERTNVKEIGAKADVLDARLRLTAAVFRIDKTNMRVPLDPTQTGAAAIQILDGVARSDGYELGATGKLTNQWQVFVGYTQLWTKLLSTTDLSQLGRQLPNAPPRSFSLWSTYDITPQLTVGGGTTYNSDTFANAQNTEYVLSYWKFDAMASYKVDAKSTIQLNIYNITKAFYYAQYYAGQAVPAPGRSASLSYRYRW
jgi:catecholate siderophore receptor